MTYMFYYAGNRKQIIIKRFNFFSTDIKKTWATINEVLGREKVGKAYQITL